MHQYFIPLFWLVELVTKILKLFIKPEIFENKDGSEIQKLDFPKKDICL